MKKVWTALAEGRVIDGDKYDWRGALGAFVNVVVLAETADTVEKLVAKWLKTADLELIDIEDVELIYDGEIVAKDVPDHLLALSKLVSETYPVQFDDFHSYMSVEDEDDKRQELD